LQPSVVFMGTPDFAVPPLVALHEASFPVSMVVTQPDRPSGRGRKLTAPPVKTVANQLGYPVDQPETVRTDSFVNKLKALAPDFLVVVAFGQILPNNILQIPKRGAINVHASLLPKYRGPAPIQWAMIRGEKETGVTTMLMDTGVDTGDILMEAKTAIHPTETSEDLHQRLAQMGADLLVTTLTGMWRGGLFPQAQRHDQATYAPMLSKKDGRIDWHKTADQLDAFVRAMTPWPGAFCFSGDKRLKILQARTLHGASHETNPGSVLEGFPDELRVATGNGVLLIEEIQGQSGKRMAAKDYLRGNPLSPGIMLR